MAGVVTPGVSLAVLLGAMVLLSGCAGFGSSRSTQESSLKLPEVVEEERVEQEQVVASSVPPSSEPVVQEPPEPIAPATDPFQPPPEIIQPFLLDIPFNFDQVGLRQDALTLLEVNASRLKDEGVGRVLLEGRGDEVGTTNYNIVVGNRRAKAVKRYLLNLGIDSGHLLTTSYGKERPLCRDHSVECWQMNRSVRFAIQ
ncbi:MAG: OmpA family protein [Nitrospirales bacterium]